MRSDRRTTGPALSSRLITHHSSLITHHLPRERPMTVAERTKAGEPPNGAYETALQQLDLVAEHLQLEPGVHALLRHPKRELTVSFPVKMDDGSLRVFSGYRVQHNTSL